MRQSINYSYDSKCYKARVSAKIIEKSLWYLIRKRRKVRFKFDKVLSIYKFAKLYGQNSRKNSSYTVVNLL